MNRPQRVVILAGLILMAAMLLFPPWHKSRAIAREPLRYSSVSAFIQASGYAFLFDPPDSQINFGRLAVQLLLVAVVCGGVVVMLHKKPNP